MQNFQPRQVEWSAPWRWSRETLALIGRRPAAFGLAGLVLLGSFFALMQVQQKLLRFGVALLWPPLGLAGFVRIAEAADHGRSLRPREFFPSNRETFGVALLAACGYGLVFALILAFGGGTGDGLGLADAELAERAQRLVEAAAVAVGLPFAYVSRAVLFGASLAAFSGLLLALFVWFVLPLIQLGGASPTLALRLSFDAYRLNARTLGLTGFAPLSAFVTVLLLSLGLAAVLAAPFLGGMLYVSYREIFLGRAENAPAATRQTQLAPALS